MERVGWGGVGLGWIGMRFEVIFKHYPSPPKSFWMLRASRPGSCRVEDLGTQRLGLLEAWRLGGWWFGRLENQFLCVLWLSRWSWVYFETGQWLADALPESRRRSQDGSRRLPRYLRRTSEGLLTNLVFH